MATIIVLTVIIIICALAIWFAFRVARWVQKSIDEQKNKKQENKNLGWLSHFHSIWWGLGAAAGGFKFLYREWKTAPAGSSEKLVWTLVLSLICAFVLWIAVKLLDYKLNSDSEPFNTEVSNDTYK